MPGNNVVISPNIKKTAVRIDMHGNEIDPKTKKVIKSVSEGRYIPTPEEMKKAVQGAKPAEEAQRESSVGLESIIAQKLGEKIGGAIEKALEKIDISDMVDKAIEKALTKK